ncbi:UvrABC system protein C [compost metagenome]
MLGSKNFFPQVGIEEETAEVMSAFLSQYYLASPERDLPSELIVNVVHEDFEAITAALNAQIKNGNYGKVLARWNLGSEAITESRTNPPGLPKS